MRDQRSIVYGRMVGGQILLSKCGHRGDSDRFPVSANSVSRDLGVLAVRQGKMRLKMVRPGGSLESLSSRDLAKGTPTDYVWANSQVFVKLDAMSAKNSNPVGAPGKASPIAPRRRIVINGKQFQPKESLG